jgi:hypothetical protein
MEEKPENAKALATVGAANPFEIYADAVAPRTIVGRLLKFTKGDFVVGEAGEAIPQNTEFMMLMDEALCGWCKWEDSKPVEHKMGRIADNFIPPQRAALGDVDKMAWEEGADGKMRDPWQFTNYIPMKREPDGELFTFAATSRGSLNAVGDLCRQYARHARKHPDQYPVVKLFTGTYEHKVKAYGKIAFPIFTIVGWAQKEELDLDRATATPTNEELPFDDRLPPF